MIQRALLMLLVVGSGMTQLPANGSRKLVCYYNQDHTPVLHRLDPSLCTHVIVGFISLEHNSYVPAEPVGLEPAKALKTRNPELKVMVSIGCTLASSIQTDLERRQLAQTTIQYARGLDVDGVDFDWEFPRWTTGDSAETPNFAEFLQVLREAVELEAETSERKPLLLSVAVAAPQAIIGLAYEIPRMAEALDFINLMTYDFYYFRWYWPFTAPNAPLFPRPIEKGIFRNMNTAWAAQRWHDKGMPKEKIMVGIPFYGRTWKLLNARAHGLNSLAVSEGFGGGFSNYPQVCEMIAKGAVRKFNEPSQTPYVYLDKDWVSYDDEVSVAAKAEWIENNNFGGAMIYNLNCDDWDATCPNSTAPFPLLSTVARCLQIHRPQQSDFHINQQMGNLGAWNTSEDSQ